MTPKKGSKKLGSNAGTAFEDLDRAGFPVSRLPQPQVPAFRDIGPRSQGQRF